MYEYANGLRRRGHEINIAHGAFWGRPGVSSLEEISWFDFEPGITHHFGGSAIPLPRADIIFGTGAPPELGLPVLLIQGFEMFPKHLEREVFRTPCLKICVASWLCDAGVAYGVPSDQLAHVPMGIDHDTFRTVTPLDSRTTDVGILYSPHMAKGWAPGLQALEQVRARCGDISVVSFGTEEPDDALPSWVTFVHDPERRVLARGIYNSCRVFLQPSMYEGFGFTAVEAMACGCALVTTNNGGSRDYAVHGDTALVAEPGDIAALASHVERLLRDDETRERLANRGSEFVRRFEWDDACALLEQHLQRYVDDPAAFQLPPIDELGPSAPVAGL